MDPACTPFQLPFSVHSDSLVSSLSTHPTTVRDLMLSYLRVISLLGKRYLSPYPNVPTFASEPGSPIAMLGGREGCHYTRPSYTCPHAVKHRSSVDISSSRKAMPSSWKSLAVLLLTIHGRDPSALVLFQFQLPIFFSFP